MATVAKLSASVEANTDNFSRGMARAKGDLQNFSNTVPNTNSSIQKFETQMNRVEVSTRQFGHAAGILGTSLGGSGAMIGDAARSFLMMGPAIGGVIAGFILYNKIQEDSEAKMKKTIEINKEFNAVIKETKLVLGELRAPGTFSADVSRQIDTVTEKIEKFVKEGGSPIQIHELQRYGRELEARQIQLRELDKAQSDFALEDFNNKQKTKPDDENSSDRTIGHIEALQKYADALQRQLSAEPEGGKLYNSILADQLNILSQIQDANESLAAKRDALAKQAEQKELAFQAHLREEAEKVAKASTDYFNEQIKMAKKMEEETKTPLEKFYDQVQSIFDLFDDGGISIETMDRAIKKAFKELDNSQMKLEKEAEKPQGSLTQVDLENINPLFNTSKKQVTEVPELKETNKLLEEIRKSLGLPKPARTSA